jgi:hypothetical protein
VPDYIPLYPIIEVQRPSVGRLGPVAGFSTSDTALLAAQFPAGPTQGTDEKSATNKKTKENFTSLVMRGPAEGSQGYWGYPKDFNRNYVENGAPKYKASTWIAPGDPLNSFVPDIRSPGGIPGTINLHPHSVGPGFTGPLFYVSLNVAEKTLEIVSPNESSGLIDDSSFSAWTKNKGIETLGKYIMGQGPNSPND